MLAQALADALNLPLNKQRANGTFKGVTGFVRLWRYAFNQAGAGVNLTVQRLFVPVLLKGLFTRSKTLVVLHHYDKREPLSPLYHWNFRLLVWLLKIGYRNAAVVVVAPYWENLLKQLGIGHDKVFTFPNLFNPTMYQPTPGVTKKKQVYLGQHGAKQHPMIHEIAKALQAHGYTCYYTTPFPEQAQPEAAVPVWCLSHQAYLQALQESVYTVCVSAFNEGWNRIAHESLLAGTPVVGNFAGGLGNLLQQAEQVLVTNANEAVSVILQNRNMHIPSAFIERYHIQQISYYAKPIVAFCRHGIS